MTVLYLSRSDFFITFYTRTNKLQYQKKDKKNLKITPHAADGLVAGERQSERSNELIR